MFNKDCLMYHIFLSNQLLFHFDYINIIHVMCFGVVNVHTRDRRVLNLNPISKIPKRNIEKTKVQKTVVK